MADLNLGHMISKFNNYQALNANKAPNTHTAQTSFNAPQTPSPAPNTPMPNTPAPQMGNMGGTGQAAYVKDLMKLPQNMNELVFIYQKNISYTQFNQQFAARMNMQKNELSQTQAQILAQLQGLSISDAQNMLLQGHKALLSQFQSSLRNLPLSAHGLINLSDMAALIQANGKDAIAKLITTMANSAKLGITDLSQLKESAKLINASIAAASKNDAAQTMKMLLLLYLPWLPLQEGTGFDLDIETKDKGDDSDSILIITITTINYDIVTATLILESSNSVHVNIECINDFPKDELILRVEGDEKHYSMQSVVSFETTKSKLKTNLQEKPEAKINMSNTNEINPYMLLMAHTIIRHVIEIDKTNARDKLQNSEASPE